MTQFPALVGTTGFETAMDIEWAHAMAPGANILVVEWAPVAGSIYLAANYAASQPGVAVVSISYGNTESAAAQNGDPVLGEHVFTTHPNVAFVAATGDNGLVNYPASSPNVIAVGGTEFDNLSNPVGGQEMAWPPGGGGVSELFPVPSYQQGVVPKGTQGRGVPDVAMDASNADVCDLYDSPTSPWTTAQGTSLGAPMFSGLVADADQGRAEVGLSPLGTAATLNTLYGLDKSGYYSSSFNDITAGSNGHFAAGPGYDFATGLGTPQLPALLTALSAPTFVQTAVGHDALGNEVVFGISSGNHEVYFQDFNSSVVPTTGWQLAGVGQVSQIAVGENPQENPVLFAISSSPGANYGSVYYVDFAFTGSTLLPTPHPYWSAGTGPASQIAVGESSTGNPVLFAISSSPGANYGSVYYVDFAFNTSNLSESRVHDYWSAGQGTASQIAVGQNLQGKQSDPVLFAISSSPGSYDGWVYYVDFAFNPISRSEAAVHGYWSAGQGSASQIAVGENPQGPVLFAISSSPGANYGSVYYVDFAFNPINLSETAVHGYWSAGQGPASQIAVGESPEENPVLFAVSSSPGANDGSVYYVDFAFNASTLAESPTHGYYPAGNGPASQISVGENAENPVLFAISSSPGPYDGSVYYVNFAFDTTTAEIPTHGYYFLGNGAAS